MSGLILCSKQAVIPYHIEEANINIYSMEELSYYMYNNIYMINKEFFSKRLYNFIDTELEQKAIAEKLDNLTKNNGTFAEMSFLLISAGSYYSYEELNSIAKTLQIIGSKNIIERLKSKADICMESRKYKSAIATYKEALNMEDDDVSPNFYADLWNNLGVAYTKIFLLEDAKKCFCKAIDIYIKNNEIVYKTQTIKNLIFTELLDGDEQGIKDDAQKYKIEEDVLEHCKYDLEKRRKYIISNEAYKKLSDTLTYNTPEDMNQYYDRIQNMLDSWKSEYRDEVI